MAFVSRPLICNNKSFGHRKNSVAPFVSTNGQRKFAPEAYQIEFSMLEVETKPDHAKRLSASQSRILSERRLTLLKLAGQWSVSVCHSISDKKKNR